MRTFCLSLSGVCALAVAVFLAGCEGTSTNPGIQVEPASATLTNSAAVTFTATVSSNQTLFFPLEWQVTDPSIGRIVTSQGTTAVYESFGVSGNNSVIVKDQSDSEGVALVVQL